jgi:hypothetical protein
MIRLRNTVFFYKSTDMKNVSPFEINFTTSFFSARHKKVGADYSTDNCVVGGIIF